jgi:hypothetical protein
MPFVIQFRRDTAANWTSANPTLADGEMGIESDTQKYKIGNGYTVWNSLSYSSLPSTALSATTVDAKGDILVGTADDTIDNLSVGANGYVLEADSGETSGLKWSDRKSIGLNAQTGTTYTLALDDAGKVITATNASPVTITVPGNSAVAYPIGTQIVVVAGGAGAVTFSPVVGVTVNSKDSNLTIDGQYASACLLKVSTNTWILFGALTT